MLILQKYGMTALVLAAYEGHEQVLNALLNAGANPDITDYVCTCHAINSSINWYNNIQNGDTALMKASKRDHANIVRTLMERNVSSNVMNKVNNRECVHCLIIITSLLCAGQTGVTALHIAARNGSVETLSIILEGGTDMEIRDEVSCFIIIGFTLHIWRNVAGLSYSCVIIILQKYGMTALAWAAGLGHKKVVDVLLKAGANPDAQDYVSFNVSSIELVLYIFMQEGDTALMDATRRGHKEIVKALLENQANPNIVNEVDTFRYIIM